MSVNATDIVLTESAQFESEDFALEKLHCSDDNCAGKFGFIKAGMYAGHFVKINSENKKCKRFNMMLVSENGTFLRKKSGAVIHTALARTSFATLETTCTVDSTINLNDALRQSGSDELIIQRTELMSQDVQLQTYPPKVNSRPSSHSTGSAPRGGHSNHGNSCKTKSSCENRASSDALEESRNNLYWVMKDISPASPPGDGMVPSSNGNVSLPASALMWGFPCLWYGGGEEVTKTTQVIVQRLILPECYVLNKSAEVPYWRSDEQLLSVERIKLLPMDEDLVERMCKETYQPVAAHYLVSLLLFAEWADSFRDSFVWPEFIANIFTDDKEVVALCDRATQHILNRSEIGRTEPCWVFLFLIAAQHIGILDQLDVDEYATSGVCSIDLTQLMKELSLLQGGDAAVRSCSRVGIEYQATVFGDDTENMSQCSDADITRISQDASLRAFSPSADVNTMDASSLDTFLGRVQLLRERYLVVGQLIEAPLNWTEFIGLLTTAWEKKSSTRVTGDVVQNRLALMTCWTELVSSLRAAGRKVTGMCSVRQPVSSLVDGVTSTVKKSLWEVDLEVLAPVSLETNDQLMSRWTCLQCCKLFSVPEDTALEVLHACHGDMELALREIEAMLSKSQAPRVFQSNNDVSTDIVVNSPCSYWNPYVYILSQNEMRWFFFSAKKYYNNLRRVWRKYNKMRCRALVINTVAGAVAAPVTGPVTITVTSAVTVTNITAATDAVSEGVVTGAAVISTTGSVEASSQSSAGEQSKTVESTSFNEVLTSRVTVQSEASNNLTLSDTLRLFAALFPGDDDSQFTAAMVPLSMAHAARQHQPLQWNQFAKGTSNSSSQQSHKPAPSKLFVLKRGNSDPALEARRDPSVPNRWPSSLPLMSHNLYWMKTSNSPCMCVGLDPISLRSGGTDGSLSIITICCATYHHAVSVQASKLEPLDEEIVKQCSDERAVGFALAMMDFADWELQSLSPDSPLRKWYVFPSFIHKFLQHMPTFAAWRKQAERAGRQFRSDRRKMYFSGLVETFNSNRVEEDKDPRLTMTTYPWDESELLVVNAKEEKPSGTETASSDSNIIQSSKSRPSKRKATDNDSVDSAVIGKLQRSEGDGEDLSLITSKPASSSSLFNLFWVSKAGLPCLYYDTIENRFNDKITILPVCCTTYHYPVEAMQSYLEPLTPERLKQCTDDRTQDFSLALVDFARWESRFIAERPASAPEVETDGDVSGSMRSIPPAEPRATDGGNFYLWPEFVLDMLNSPKEWAAWRKRVERKAAGKQGPRSYFYFEALRADYEESLATVSSSTSSCNNDSNGTLDSLGSTVNAERDQIA